MDWQTVGMAFGLILFMEMGDKTQLAVLTLVARTGRVVAVSLGAAAGLTAVVALGVTVGAAATELVPHSWLALGAGTLFVLLGLLTLWSAVKGAGDDQEEIKGRQVLASGHHWAALGGIWGKLWSVVPGGDGRQVATGRDWSGGTDWATRRGVPGGCGSPGPADLGGGSGGQGGVAVNPGAVGICLCRGPVPSSGRTNPR